MNSIMSLPYILLSIVVALAVSYSAAMFDDKDSIGFTLYSLVNIVISSFVTLTTGVLKDTLILPMFIGVFLMMMILKFGFHALVVYAFACIVLRLWCILTKA